MTAGIWGNRISIRKALVALSLVLALLFVQVPGTAGLTDDQKINAYYTLISMKINSGAYEEALESIEKCLELAGSNDLLSADLWLKKGAVYAMLPNYDLALPALEKALAYDAEMAEAHLIIAQIRFEQQDMTNAVEHMEKYLALKPEDTAMYSLLAEMHFTLGQYKQAQDAYSKYIDVGQEADPAALYMRGVSFLQSGLFEEAIGDFSMVIDSPEHGRNARYNRAVSYMQLGRMEEAEADFSYLLDAGAQIEGLAFNRGVVRMSLGDLQGAIADFDSSIDKGEQWGDAILNRSACYLQLEQFEEAEKGYTLYIEETGEKDTSVYYRGISFLSRERYEEAIDDFTVFLDEAVQKPGLQSWEELSAWARNYRAAAHMGAGRFEEAIIDLTRNIDLGLLSAVSYYNRSLCYQQMGKADLAEQDLMKSLEADSQDSAQSEADKSTAPVTNKE